MRREREVLPQNPNWIVIPFLDQWEMTKAVVLDALDQWLEGRRPNIMLVSNGSSDETNREAVAWVRAATDLLLDVDILFTGHRDGVTLNMAWNMALWQIWEFGGERALVVNNDIRMHGHTFAVLNGVRSVTGALFVTGIGVTKAQFEFFSAPPAEDANYGRASKGGPDFSCFLITKACHLKFPFDPRFTFAGDWDYHTRLKRAGLGDKIFGVNVPYLHIGEGSQTLKRMRETDPEKARLIEQTADQHRALYAEKWGGTFGQETLEKPKWEVEV